MGRRLTGEPQPGSHAGNVDDSPRELVGVYRTLAEAQAAAEAVRRSGVPAAQVQLARPADAVIEMEAESRQEAAQGWVLFPKEVAKGIAVLVPFGALIGALLGLLVAALTGVGATTLTLSGAACGAVCGFLVGALLGAREPEEESAADRGVTLRSPATAEARQAMLAPGLLRLDEVRTVDDEPIATITTEEDEVVGGVWQQILASGRRPDQRMADRPIQPTPPRKTP